MSCMPRKSEVYTWRVSPAMKASLEEAARNRKRSVARLLEQLVEEGLEAAGGDQESDANRQGHLHRLAAPFLGCIDGGDPRRSVRTRELVRARLKRQPAHVR